MPTLNAELSGKSYAVAPVPARARSLLGGLPFGDWRSAMIARGFGWNTTIGTLSTGITGGGAGDVLDIDQPEFVLSVPTGFTLVPLRFFIQARIGIQTDDSHTAQIVIAVDRAAAWNGTPTDLTKWVNENPTTFNLRTGATSGCPIACASAFTGDITVAPVHAFDLARKEAITDEQEAATPATVNVYEFDLLYEPKASPFIVGPGAVYGYWGGEVAVVGYAQLEFLAIPSALVRELS